MCLGKKMLILASSLIGASACSAVYVAYTHQNPEKSKAEEENQVTQNIKNEEKPFKDVDPLAAFA